MSNEISALLGKGIVLKGIVLFLCWGVVPLQVAFLLHALLNTFLLRRLKPLPLSEVEMLNVSVLVPARNEERQIRQCLESLLAQQPPVREILLLDDRSTDGTALIARELGFREGKGNRLRLLPGEELPAGWVGKNWACHQLAQAADPTSGHLLFTDADTIHDPSCVRSALDHAQHKRFDLLSLWSDQETGSWSEKLVIPLGYLLFMAFQPFVLLEWLQANPERVRRFRIPRAHLAAMGLANGQFLLFRRDAYTALGGHEALKDHLVEDLAFGRRVAACTGDGMRLGNADGMDLLRCRMYTRFSELWEGFSKNLRPAFEESSLRFMAFGVVVGGLFMAPFLLLPFSTFFPVAIPCLWVSVGLVLAIRLLLTIRFQTSWLSLLLHPVALLLTFCIALNSWRLCLRGGVNWKGRNYTKTIRSSVSLKETDS